MPVAPHTPTSTLGGWLHNLAVLLSGKYLPILTGKKALWQLLKLRISHKSGTTDNIRVLFAAAVSCDTDCE
jgi:hypothetical protein